MVYAVQIQCRQSQQLLTNGQHPLNFVAEAIPQVININIYHWENNCGKYADGFYNAMIDDKDSHIPSPPIMFTCTSLRNPLLERQIIQGVHPKASKSKPTADDRIVRTTSTTRMTQVRTHPAAPQQVAS